jgi:hypothetical protein
MENSVSRRLNILCIAFKIITFYLFARLYVRISILLTCGKHLHDHKHPGETSYNDKYSSLIKNGYHMYGILQDEYSKLHPG